MGQGDLMVQGRSLAELETVIERGLTTFVEVGQALLEIREHRLYREAHDSFEGYCRERFNFNRQRASQLIEAAEVSRILDTPPTRASHAEALAPLKSDPEAVREVYAGVQAEYGEKATAADVRAAVERRLYPFACESCGERFDLSVWHCPVCAHHWTDLGSPCKNCLSGGHYEYPPGYGMTEEDLEPCACGRCYRAAGEPISDLDGTPYATLPFVISPDPLTEDEIIEASGGDDGGRVRSARLRAAYSTGLRATLELIALNPDAVADVLAPHQVPVARSFTRDVRDWCDRIDSALDRGIRLVSREEARRG